MNNSNPQDIYNSILRYAGELNGTPQAGQFLLIGCLLPVPQGETLPVSVAPTTTAHSPKPKSKGKAKATVTDKEPLLETFTRKKGLTDQHFALLLGTLQQEGWISQDTQPDDFILLFSGRPSDCRITWNPAVGKGILRDLFKMMIDGRFIAPPDGYQYLRIVESHFIYPNGQHLHGLKGGYTSRKAASVIDSCRKILLLTPRAKDYRGIQSEIDDEFSDIRYSPYD
ncbi:MAG: hypothetical protein IKK87_08495 [Bacteroidaceae bacterium]|nr:hypothetical protein [Bacteroidaceae bacterium]